MKVVEKTERERGECMADRSAALRSDAGGGGPYLSLFLFRMEGEKSIEWTEEQKSFA